MKFLVILLCAGINHVWTREKFSFSDAWFIRFSTWMEDKSGNIFPSLMGRELIALLLSLCLPAFVLAAVLMWLDGLLFGLLSMLVHAAIVLYGFGRINFNELLQNYQERIRVGDVEGAFRYICELSNDPKSHSVVDSETAHRFFCNYFIYKFFQRLFVILFLYLLLGPVLVLVYHLLTCEKPAGNEESETQSATMDAAHSLVNVLEWIPLRIVGLTFSLAGDFTCCFNELKESFVETDMTSPDLLTRYAFAALGQDHQAGQPQRSSTEDTRAGGILVDTAQSSPQSYTSVNVGEDGETRAAAQRQLLQLHSLLNRSLIIWISIVALFTVYGFGL